MGETSERVKQLMEALGPWAIGDASDAEGARILTEALDAARREGAESALPAADLARGARTLAQRDLVRAIRTHAGSALAEAAEYEFSLLATREGQLVAECERVREALDAARAECERLRKACKSADIQLTRYLEDDSAVIFGAAVGLRGQLRAALAPPPAATSANVYACGCSGSDGRCPLHGDYPVDAKGGSVTDETVLYSDRELAREVCALFDEAHGGTPMAVLADRIARRIAEFRRACIAASVERAERAERGRDYCLGNWHEALVAYLVHGQKLAPEDAEAEATTRLNDVAVRAAAGLDAKGGDCG